MVIVSYDFRKKEAIYLVLIISSFGFGFVVAYNPSGTGGAPEIMGHSVDEMDWTNDALQFCLNGSCVNNWSQVLPSGQVTEICLNGDCITNWNNICP
jgi:hypothetical protein